MAPLFVLLGTFAALWLVGRLRPARALSPGVRGRAALGAMFLFTGVSHFVLTDEMAAMVPPVLPAPSALIYLTGALQLAAAVALLVSWRPRLVGWAVVAMLVALLPANVYAAVAGVGMGGHTAGPRYLWFRVPLQLLFIWWAWFFTRERGPQRGRAAR
jgi:uncharacterized membrane protein